MRTGLVRRYGEKDTVQEYIDVVVKHFRLSREVRNTALKMSYVIAQKTAINNLYKSMLAMALVNLAAMEKHRRIPSKAWSGDCTCSYPTLSKHSENLKKILENQFPNLKYV